jgi:hypothetical protein
MAINYAKNTKINSSRSEDEIRQMLKNFGAANIIPLDNLVVGDKTLIGVMFDYESRRVKIMVELPDPADVKFTTSPAFRNHRTKEQCHQFYLKEIDRLWRAVAFKMKARLVEIEDGISDFEEAFFYNIVAPGSPDGATVGQIMRPQLERAYQAGKLPPLLPGIGETS